MFQKVLSQTKSKYCLYKYSENEYLNKFIIGTTYSFQVYESVWYINKILKKNPDKINRFWAGHVGGIRKRVHYKAVDMAINYFDIISNNYIRRLKALKRIKAEATNYESLEMPLNTYRVLIHLIKETVKEALKDKPDVHKQYQLISDFYEALSGRANIIRYLMNTHGLFEPEEPDVIHDKIDQRDFFPARDDLVYTNLSSGRKTPAETVLAAWEKGVSRITVAFDDFDSPKISTEAVPAGEILGIDVDLGLEFIVRDNGNHFHQILLLENCRNQEDYYRVFENQDFKEFQAALKKNIKAQEHMFMELMFDFNGAFLNELNQKELKDVEPLLPIGLKELKEYAQGRKIHHVHLGRFLYKHISDHLRNLQDKYPTDNKLKEKIRKIFKQIDPVYLRKNYFDIIYFKLVKEANFISYIEANELLKKIDIKNTIGELIKPKIVFSRPLLHGLKRAIEYLIVNHEHIDAIEIWNNRITSPEYLQETQELNTFCTYLNNGDLVAVNKYLEQRNITVDQELVINAVAHYFQKKIYKRFVSASDGGNKLFPGIGIAIEKIHNWAELKNVNNVQDIKFMVKDVSQTKNFLGILDVENAKGKGNLYPLGKSVDYARELLPEDKTISRYTFKNYFKDLNKDIKNVFKIITGFSLAGVLDYCLHLFFNNYLPFGVITFAIWFVITYGRCLVADLWAYSGFRPWRWRWHHFDRNNAANAVFFSYQSVPLLRSIEYFIDFFILGFTGLAGINIWQRMIRFIPIGLSNGLYIYSHNTLRGFEKSVKRKNIFRSFFSVPVAIALSYIIELVIAAVSAVIINKTASDIVAGVIEGRAKSRRHYKLRMRDLNELVPRAILRGNSNKIRRQRMQDLLDIMSIWRYEPMGYVALQKKFEQMKLSIEDLNYFNEPLTKRDEYRKYILESSLADKEILEKEFLAMNTAFALFIARQKIKAIRRLPK